MAIFAPTNVSVLKLTEFSVNKPGVITGITDLPVSTRLVEFGIFEGSDFVILNKASFNGPVFIRVGENRIALRRAEASAILVK